MLLITFLFFYLAISIVTLKSCYWHFKGTKQILMLVAKQWPNRKELMLELALCNSQRVSIENY